MYYTLEELSNYQDTNLNLVVEIPEGETTVQKEIFTNDNLNFFMRNVYGKRILIKDCESLQDAFTTFVDYFVYYKTIFQDDLNRLYNAWITEYNPLDNYDRHEDSSTDTSKEESHSISESGENSNEKSDDISGTDSTTEIFKNTTEEYESGMNSSATYTPDRKSTNASLEKGNTTDTSKEESHSISESGSFSSEKSDDISGTDSTTVSSHIRGNIGVMSSQDLEDQEQNLRMKMQIENYVKLIVDKFTIMI